VDITQLFKTLENKGRLIKAVLVPLLLILMGSVLVLVYYTGGIKYVYSHSMYIPIVLGALIFGVRGGILFGLLGGLTLGPFMPIDVETGEMQNTINWLYRTGFFVLIGFIAGLASDVVGIYLNKLKWNSRHDEYTGLPNRHALIEELPNYAANTHPPAMNILLVASVNNTRQLKTAFGIDVIDTAIEQISERYAKRLKEMGHEFHVYRADAGSISTLVTNTPSQKLKTLLKELAKIAKKPFEFQGIPIHVDFRMGFVPFDTVSNPPQPYLQYAESAMNQAHETLKDFLGYSEDLEGLVRENMSLLGELVDAIELNQLALHYQPKIDTKTGKVVSVEALMRWHHPNRGNVPPDVFIPCAEQSTLIFDITTFALETALKQIVRWNKQGIDLSIAVNVSPLNLGEPGFADIVIALLSRYGVDGHKLELEVTEGALMLDIATSTKELNKLAEKGIIISVDDFGTGYSSLQYLDKLPISTIKIDQSFIRQLSEGESSSHIVEATISLAHRLKMNVVAEGVEDQDTLDYLLKNECDYVQGYLFSKPLAETEFDNWLKQYERNRSRDKI
jgi:EAL domain-containing protein (putative c-di-GMP-specific phosphodiesterase class I)/GGDEF domain-containing protein